MHATDFYSSTVIAIVNYFCVWVAKNRIVSFALGARHDREACEKRIEIYV